MNQEIKVVVSASDILDEVNLSENILVDFLTQLRGIFKAFKEDYKLIFSVRLHPLLEKFTSGLPPSGVFTMNEAIEEYEAILTAPYFFKLVLDDSSARDGLEITKDLSRYFNGLIHWLDFPLLGIAINHKDEEGKINIF